ncbi:MAG: MEDS domain-containing protein [Desulfovermiculus sp.]
MPDLSSMMQLSVGDHLCCLYMTEEEHREILVPFIRDGLEQGDKVLYIVDARTAESILGFWDRQSPSTVQYPTSGQLVIAESRETYIRNGLFDPDAMLAMLQVETDAAVSQGFRALRVTGEMSWALRGLPGSERLMEYEGKLNQFFPANPVIGMCQYDMRRFEPNVLLDVLATHPIAVVRNTCYENMYYMPPEEFLGPNRAEAEFQRRIKNLEERRQLDIQHQEYEEKLRASEAQARREAAFSNAIVDTAGALIVVLDPEGRIVRFNRTCEQLSGYSTDEVLGHKIWDLLIPPEEVEQARSAVDQLRQGNFPNCLEYNWVARDGARLQVTWSNTCLLDDSGRVDLIISIGLDISDISRMDRAQSQELNNLKAYSTNQNTSISAESLGVRPLSQSDPDVYHHLVKSMQDLLDLALEQSVYKVRHDLSARMCRLAEAFGHFRAGPKDMIQTYIQALQRVTKDKNPKMVRAYTNEGRLLRVELMGYLAAYYFNHCLGESMVSEEQKLWSS